MRPPADQAALLQKGHLGAQHLGLPQVVGGQEHGDPGLPVEAENLLPDMLRHLLVQARGGFIQEEQFGVVDQGLGQGETLLEAGGEALEGDGRGVPPARTTPGGFSTLSVKARPPKP